MILFSRLSKRNASISLHSLLENLEVSEKVLIFAVDTWRNSRQSKIIKNEIMASTVLNVVYWFWLTVLFLIPNLVYTLCFLFLHRLSVWDFIPAWVDTFALFLRWLSHQNLCPKTVDSHAAWQNQSIFCQPSSWRCKDRHFSWTMQAYSWFCCQNVSLSSCSCLSPRSSPM